MIFGSEVPFPKPTKSCRMSPGGKVSLVFGDEGPKLPVQQRANRPSPGGKVSLVFGDEVPLQSTPNKVSNRLPPGGKVNLVLGDQFYKTSSTMAPTATRSDSMSAPLSPKFDQSLHRSLTFQSTLFSDDAAAAPLSPTKAAKRVIAPPTADTAVFSPPRPAKKQVESVDSSMPSIMKPPNQESTSSKASNKYITRYLHAAGTYRPPTGYITDGETSASPRSAKKMVSPRNDTTMRFYFGTEEPSSPVRKARVPPGGHSSVSFL